VSTGLNKVIKRGTCTSIMTFADDISQNPDTKHSRKTKYVDLDFSTKCASKTTFLDGGYSRIAQLQQLIAESRV